MIAKIGRTLLAILGTMSIASTAMAQGNTFNPYGNSGYADYREFGNPMYSNNPALPGQALLNSKPLIGRPRANSFQDYTNELDGAEPDSAAARRSRSSNLPYFTAYQQLNSNYNRVYRPNATDKDKEFYERQRLREKAYADAMKETDPVKRAKLLRQADQYSLDRPAASTRPGAAKSATAPKSRANGSATAPRSSSAPVERRQSAPSPYATDTTRRSGTTGRAPAPPVGRSTAPPPSRPSTSRDRQTTDPSTVPTPPPR